MLVPVGAAVLLVERRRWTLAPASALVLVLLVAGIVSCGSSISNAVALS